MEHIPDSATACTNAAAALLTLGSEATIVRDVVVENCRIIGNVRIATLKLRPDTPQHYEDITFRNITSEVPASAILAMQPWSQ